MAIDPNDATAPSDHEDKMNMFTPHTYVSSFASRRRVDPAVPTTRAADTTADKQQVTVNATDGEGNTTDGAGKSILQTVYQRPVWPPVYPQWPAVASCQVTHEEPSSQ